MDITPGAELVIGARETENTIGNGFGDGYFGMNMATKFYPGVPYLKNRGLYRRGLYIRRCFTSHYCILLLCLAVVVLTEKMLGVVRFTGVAEI